MEKVANKFNILIEEFFEFLRAKNLERYTVENIYRMKNLIVSNDKHAIICELGPILLKYKNEINNRNDSFFLNYDFKEEISALPKGDEFDVIGLVKKNYSKMSKNELNTTWDITNDLYKTYLLYLIAQH